MYLFYPEIEVLNICSNIWYVFQMDLAYALADLHGVQSPPSFPLSRKFYKKGLLFFRLQYPRHLSVPNDDGEMYNPLL